MNFNEKLQELRKQKGLTQEELAKALFVSRTAVSKWESGRGFPNIDSLKAIATFFSLSVDELLSSDELLTIAQEDTNQNKKRICDLVFSLLDIAVAMLLFLPFFAEKTGSVINELPLLSLNAISYYLKIVYIVFVAAIVIWGVLTLALQNCAVGFWVKNKSKISLLLSAVGSILFVISLQPYAATFLFIFLVIKVLMLVKW